MQITRTPIEGMLVIDATLHRDARGFFVERYHQQAFDQAVGQPVRFVQDNQSRSARGVLRGLHYQQAPHAQGRLVSVTQGVVFDVAVDLRCGSASFGQWHAVVLDGEQPRSVWLPPGLAHGFLVMSESADFLYKTTGHHVQQAERCIRWDDPLLAIDWPLAGRAPLLSARDAHAPLWTELPDADRAG